MPMHVGQTALDSVVIEGELLVIQAQQVQNRGVEVVDRGRVSRQLLTEIDQGSVTRVSIAAASWQSARRVQLRAEFRCEQWTAYSPTAHNPGTIARGLYRGTGDCSINRKIGNDQPRAAAWGAEGVRATRLAPRSRVPKRERVACRMLGRGAGPRELGASDTLWVQAISKLIHAS